MKKNCSRFRVKSQKSLSFQRKNTGSFAEIFWLPIRFWRTARKIGRLKTAADALILGKGQEDGILVCADAANVPAYTSYVSNARWIYQAEQYPGLFRFNQDMIKAADRFVQKAVEKQQNGIYRMQKYELYDSLDEIPAQAAVLTEMLENRTEISYLENTDEEVIVQPELRV